jgi:SAM-dependent methyltransferase
MADSADLEAFYTRFYTEDPEWATPHPNRDEASRWASIETCLDRIARGADRRSAPGARGLRTLDVGCGRGWLTNLASAYVSCEGIDPTAGPIRLAQSWFPQLRFRVGTMADLLGSPEFQPYDVVISSEVIEHVEDQQQFVLELGRCLVPGGHVIITTPRGEAYGRYERMVGRAKMQPIESWLTEKELRALFVRNGFTPVWRTRAYVDLPYMSSLHRLCARLGSSPIIERSHLRWCLERLRGLAAIYQVWCFRKMNPLV